MAERPGTWQEDVEVLMADLRNIHQLVLGSLEKASCLICWEEMNESNCGDIIPVEGPRLEAPATSELLLHTSSLSPLPLRLPVQSRVHADVHSAGEQNDGQTHSMNATFAAVGGSSVLLLDSISGNQEARSKIALGKVWAKTRDEELSEGLRVRIEWSGYSHQTGHAFTTPMASKVNSNYASRSPVSSSLSILGNGSGKSGAFSSCWVIESTSATRLLWDLLSVFFVTLDMLVAPLHLLRNLGVLKEPVEFVEWACTIFWTCDIIMNFRTSVWKDHKNIISPCAIAKHYAKTWLILDLAIVVSEWLSRSLIWDRWDNWNAFRVTRWGKFFKVARLLRFSKLTKKMTQLEEVFWWREFILVCALGLVKLTFFFCISVHGLTCLWYYIGDSSGGWVHKGGWADASATVTYVLASRWVIAQVNGRTDLETDRTIMEVAYTFFCGVIALLIMALFISLLTTRMTDLTNALHEKKKASRSWTKYLDIHGNKLDLKMKVFIHNYVQENTIDDAQGEAEDKLKEVLPRFLQLDLFYQVRKPILEEFPLFRDVTKFKPNSLREVCLSVVTSKPEKQLTALFEKGDLCQRMLFVESGTLYYSTVTGLLAIMKESEESEPTMFKKGLLERLSLNPEHTRVSENDWSCEQALWVSVWHNRGDLVTSLPCRLLSLKAEDFGNAVLQQPELLPILSLYARFVVSVYADAPNMSDLKVEGCQVWHDYSRDLSHLLGDARNATVSQEGIVRRHSHPV